MTVIQNNPWKSTTIIESINPRNISETDLEKIVEIEQDMWARESIIWEYVKCECCNKIYSKDDIFWHLSKDIKIQTVKKIEKIYWEKHIKCNNCWNPAESLFDRDKYITNIKDRYNNSESFLTLLRDEYWDIVWFEDWYLDSFETIYEREFSYYYDKIWINTIKNLIEESLQYKLPDKLFMCSSVWSEEKYANFFNIYKIMQNFFNNLNTQIEPDTLWIYEAVLGSLPHSIYSIAWAKNLWIPNNPIYSMLENISNKSSSDIFIHKNVAFSFDKSLNISAKEFIKNNKEKMKQII